MPKVVINACFGGFGLSKEACQRFWDIKGQQVWIEDDIKFKSMGLFTVWLVPPEERIESKEEEFYQMSMDERKEYNEEYSSQTWHYHEVARDDPDLIQVVEQLGDAANGSYAELRIVDVPDDANWYIEEYDGNEHVAERHRTWS